MGRILGFLIDFGSRPYNTPAFDIHDGLDKTTKKLNRVKKITKSGRTDVGLWKSISSLQVDLLADLYAVQCVWKTFNLRRIEQWTHVTHTGLVAGNGLPCCPVVALWLLQKCRRVNGRRHCSPDVVSAVFDEFVRRLETAPLTLAVDNEVDVEVSSRGNYLLRALCVAVLSDDRRRSVRTVANYDEIRTVRTAANQSSISTNIFISEQNAPIIMRTSKC